MPYNAHIIITDKNHHHHASKLIKNVGSMTNAIRHARDLAKSHDLIPTRHKWERKSTRYADNSGRYGSWDSFASRPYKNKDGETFKVCIHRS